MGRNLLSCDMSARLCLSEPAYAAFGLGIDVFHPNAAQSRIFVSRGRS